MPFSFFPAPPVKESEIFRYMRTAPTAAIKELVQELFEEVSPLLRFGVAYEKFPIRFFDESGDNGLIDLCFTKVYSKDLYKNLCGAKEIMLFAATIGIGMDRLIARYSALSPSKALALEAIGDERVESLCDYYNDLVADEYKVNAPRFSAGYGDLDLSLQKEIFKALPCANIGLTLNDSLLMSPSKSVTAIIGLK